MTSKEVHEYLSGKANPMNPLPETQNEDIARAVASET